MKWTQIGDQQCSVARTLSVIGETWTMLVLREAFMRTRRFEDFVDLTGGPRPIISDRLKRLVDDGILEKQPYGERADRFEYRLTEKGRDLWPVMIALQRWGDTWMPDPEGPPVVLHHKDCGAEITPELACPDCGGWLAARDVRAELTPTSAR